ncbi:MAG: SpoIID/LytB domain-containing protein [Myxococcota bacterium]
MGRALATVVMMGLLLPACGDDEMPTEAEFREFPLLEPFEPMTIASPDAAVCEIKVKNHGTKAMETDYLPNVLACEAPGNADPEMLKAQAIAARSYAYYHAIAKGQICNGQGCQVYSCGRTPTDAHRKAVADTSGVVMRYNDNLTIGFYVAGDSTPNADCSGNSSGVGNTEKWVTYNEGRSGENIVQTKIAWRHDPSDTDWGQNRGALSQWGAQCLAENHNYDTTKILQYYYGEDIEFTQTEGACVTEGGFEPEDPEPCGELAPDDRTIIDNGDKCLKLTGQSKYWRTEDDGHGGTLNWTKSTKSNEHNVAIWSLNPVEDGSYRIAVHIDPDHTTGTKAEYEVVDSKASRIVKVDQTQGGWIELGIFALKADTEDQMVRMSDAIGISGQVLQVDALRVSPSAGECNDNDCKNDTVMSGAEPGGDTSRGDEAASCSVGNPRSGWATLFVLGLLGLRRRRN